MPQAARTRKKPRARFKGVSGMTFKLSAQLDFAEDPRKPFEKYRSYIKENGHKFPKSVLDLIGNEKWSGGSDSVAPYYSEVNVVQVRDLGKPEAELELNLHKEMYTPSLIEISIKYRGLIDVHIPTLMDLDCNKMIWRYDQFLLEKSETDQKIFKHQIEWVGGDIWSITASDIKVSWKNH